MTTTKPTTKQIAAYLETIRAIADTVQELGSVPAGHLYARLMGVMSLETFNGMIGTLTSAGLVKQNASHLIVWTGHRPHALNRHEATNDELDEANAE